MSGQELPADRFEHVRKIGSGGMGIVYEVFDRERNVSLALKTLRELDGTALYRFKSEFRALADVQHPNLVKLYELFSEADTWYFTMELVDNVGFLDYLRPAVAGARDEDHAASPSDPEAPTRTSVRAPTRLVGDLDDQRLRGVLRQLAGALAALHAAGTLHRDIKPSNILVTPSGRVVLCDFGLATPVAQAVHETRTDDRISGTPAYMSPEQLEGHPLTTASDWYAVGVVLYEALTGQKPFDPRQLLRSRARPYPVPPGAMVPGVPVDLEKLCLDLLWPDPAARPSGADVLSRLGLTPPAAAMSLGSLAFVGREAEQARLHQALVESRGGVVVAWVRGESGIGKSALLGQLLGDAARDGACVLQGRCYEQESTPYKGVDAVIDALSHELKRLPPEHVEALLPRRIRSLTQLFPVLRRVEAVARPRFLALEPLDPFEVRIRAFEALKELLRRLAEARPLVIAIDDAQWGDTDSAALLDELVRPPDAPAMLLVIACRSETLETSPFLRNFRALERPHLELDLGPLSSEEAARLLRGMPADAATDGVGDAIVRDAGGNPFLLTALGFYSRRGHREATAPLDEMVRNAVGELPAAAQHCLEAVSVAGRPITQDVLRRVVGTGDLLDALQLLRSRRLVRSSGLHAADLVEPYHDRLREIVVAQLAPASLLAWHLRLAAALEGSDQPDHEAAALHLGAAGEAGRAAVHAIAAAEQAVTALAFDRAVRLYQLGLELDPPEGRELSQLRAALAVALVNAGRGGDAARAFLAAAEHAYAAEAVDYRGRAAAQFLRSGYIDEGLDAVRVLLAALGMRLATTPRRTVASIVLRRMRIRLRGVGFRPRDPTQIAAEQLQRLDTFAAVTTALGMVDSLRAFDFQCRHMLLALRIGDPVRVARALSVEAISRATGGSARDRRSANQLVKLAGEMSERSGTPATIGFTLCAAGMASYQLGEFRDAFDLAERATNVLREQCTGVAWELDFSALYAAWSLYYRGEVGVLADRVPNFLRDARARDDRFAETSMSTGLPNLAWLVRGDPGGARDAADAGIAGWSQLSFHLQHYWHWLARRQIELYEGQGAAAWQGVVAGWGDLNRSLLMRVTAVRIEALDLRARIALAAAAAQPDDAGALSRTAAKIARQLAGEERPGAKALARLIAAGVARVRGDRVAAQALYRSAADELAACDLGLYAAAARRRHGELVIGDQGPPIVDEADQWMSARGVVAPERMADLFAPTGRSAPGS